MSMSSRLQQEEVKPFISYCGTRQEPRPSSLVHSDWLTQALKALIGKALTYYLTHIFFWLIQANLSDSDEITNPTMVENYLMNIN